MHSTTQNILKQFIGFSNQARSSVEVEFRVMANGVSEMLWLERILEELRIPVNMPIKLYCDNKAVISIAHNPVQHDHCKRHVEIDKHFKKEISKKKTGKKKTKLHIHFTLA
jgi:hypothetical protein